MNAFFVSAEFSLVRVRRTRILELIEQGSSNAKRVLYLTEDLNRTTSSTQLGITLASIMLGFVGEAFFSEILEDLFKILEVEKFISHNVTAIIAFFMGYMIITFFHVTFGELMPKVLSLNMTETIALYVSIPLIWFMKLTHPLLRFFVWSSNSFLHLMGFDTSHTSEHADEFSEDELKIIIKNSIEKGEIEEYESKLIFNILSFTDKNVKEIFTPRIDIHALPITAQLDDIVKIAKETGFSRIPIYQDEFDHMIGFIHIKDVIAYLNGYGDNHNLDLRDLIHDVIISHEWKAVDDLFKEMQKTKTQMAIIVDEYGLVEGLVSIEDIMESIFGPIIDEFDSNDDHQGVEIKESSILAGGLISLGTFNETLEEVFDTTIASDESVTLAGYVLELFESEIPKVGEQRNDGTLCYKISQMTGNRIDLIEIKQVDSVKKN